jgi:anti-sigma B factor antagonist
MEMVKTNGPTPSDVGHLCPSVIRIAGPLLGPTQTELARRVEARLDRGERWLVVDLRKVSEIDAAGVGQLVRAFNLTRAAGGMLQIANASRRVQTLLDVTCVSNVLSGRTRM